MKASQQNEFVLEAREHLDSLETCLLSLENSKSLEASRSLIHAGFRAIHSLKGDAGFLGFTKLGSLAHAMESLLCNYRDAHQRLPVPAVEALLSAGDLAATIVDDLQNQQFVDIRRHCEKLEQLTRESDHAGECVVDWEYVPPSTSLAILPMLRDLSKLGILENVRCVPAVELSQPIIDKSYRLRGSLRTECDAITLDTTLINCGVHATRPFTHACVDQTGNLFPVHSHTEPLMATLQSLTLHPMRVALDLVYETHDISQELPGPVTGLRGIQSKGLESNELEKFETTSKVSDTVSHAVSQPFKFDNSEAMGLAENTLATTISSKIATGEQGESKTTASSETDRTTSLRINVELLDRLMNLVGELTLVRNQSQLVLNEQDGPAATVLQRLNSVTSELQETILQTRMQPVANLFGKFPRMVRDLGRQLGKQVELHTIGREVELDKTVLEQLSDPLMHLIRNSVDHGLESAEVRTALGKPASGKIILSATPADGHVLIEIRDDGKGIDPQAVRSKALAMGLRNESELQGMNPRELFSLILLPGFSTAKEVTDVSGRGVGMDVVKTNVEKLEGSLNIDSVPGVGTTIQLRVPLTLAIIPCLMVTSSHQEFAIPQRGLEEIVCLYPGSPETLGQSFDSEVYRLRNRLLPVVRFSEVIRRPQPFTAQSKAEILAQHATQGTDSQRIEYILVLRSGSRRFGLLVDDVKGTQEIVVKPMHPTLKRLGIFSGATLKGDGRIALIANAEGIAAHARSRFEEARATEHADQRDPNEVHRVLLFESGPQELFALPLVQVARVERIDSSKIERVGEDEFLSMDGRTTRLVRLDKYLKVTPMENGQEEFVILPKFVPEAMGILISQIVDNQSLSIDVQQDAASDPGILGTAIIGEKLSLFLDLHYLRSKVFGLPTLFEKVGSHDKHRQPSNHGSLQDPIPNDETTNRSDSKRILLVDDTPFFREIVKRYLTGQGFEVLTAIHGQDGLRVLEQQDFDLVVSDIEMPIMDGWTFCTLARQRGCQVPFLALTSLNKQENESKAELCGFNDFEEKLDHDRLLSKVVQMLSVREIIRKSASL